MHYYYVIVRLLSDKLIYYIHKYQETCSSYKDLNKYNERKQLKHVSCETKIKV